MNQHTVNGETLRVGVIGCGKMSRNHAKAISLAENATIVAVADSGIDASDIPDWFEEDVEFFRDAGELMSTVKPDVVHIVTPPETHYSIANLALDSGAHIYIEKPFMSTATEADDILSHAKKKGLKVCAGHQLLFTRAAGQLRDALGSIGRVVHIESFFSFNPVRRGISPVDQLVDILPHPVYLLESFLDQSHSKEEMPLGIESVWTTHDGEARALIAAGDITGSVVVTLSGRPVDSYVKITGTNGSLHADFVRGFVVKSQGPGSSVFSVLLIPFVQAWQIFGKTLGAIFRLFSERKKGYPGLPDLVSAFYESINEGSDGPLSHDAVRNTVWICEAVESNARQAEAAVEAKASTALELEASRLPPASSDKGRILLTGGTGLFGRPAAALLRKAGWPVTVLSRSVPPTSNREPGVDYVAADLGDRIPDNLLDSVETVIHAAAETAGGQSAQERNSVQATRQLLEAAEKSGITKFIHISSIAVLKPGSAKGDKSLDESSPVDLDNLSRGPYVWGKAESENLASKFDETSNVSVKIVRLGPLVNYEDYKPPGRLGREIHNLFVAMGNSKEKLSICSVQTAAQAMLIYVENFGDMPAVLNLIEPDAPTRKALLEKWKEKRSPLYTIRLPSIVLSFLSSLLVLLQKAIFWGKEPINVKSAFASQQYDASLAASILGEKVDD